MATTAVSMVRDEADVIRGTVEHLLDEVDAVLIADNNSTDGTRDILADLAAEHPEVTVIDDPEPGYWQSEKMTALAYRAAAGKARWILPFDADEIWVSHGGRIGTDLGEHGNVARAHLFNHFPSAVDPDGDDPFRTIEWRQRNPGALPKVAFRWEPGAIIHQGNHGVTLASGEHLSPAVLEVRHFPYRSAEQFIRKARNGAQAYAATDLPDNVGAHWRQYGELLDRYGESCLADVFREHFWFLSPIDHGMVRDPAPYRRWLT